MPPPELQRRAAALLVQVLAAAASAAAASAAELQPYACSGQRAVVGGVTYKTKIKLVQDGSGAAYVSANNTRVKVTATANLVSPQGGTGKQICSRRSVPCFWADADRVRMITGKAFPFEFNSPYDHVFPPKYDGGNIIGFDVRHFSIIFRPKGVFSRKMGNLHLISGCALGSLPEIITTYYAFPIIR
jgi:hypothetical protein